MNKVCQSDVNIEIDQKQYYIKQNKKNIDRKKTTFAQKENYNAK